MKKKKRILWITLGVFGTLILAFFVTLLVIGLRNSYPDYVSAWQPDSASVQAGFPKEMELFRNKTARVDGSETSYAVSGGKIQIGKDEYAIVYDTNHMTLTREGHSQTYTATGSSERYDYVIRDGGAMIVAYHGNQSTLVIPNTLGGAPVVNVYGGINNWRLVKVVFPDTVTSIGENLFHLCDQLEEVTMPASLQEIGDRAFLDCNALKEITIPAGVTSIGDSAFASCALITSIDLPEGLTQIGDSVFTSCSALKSVTFPKGLTSIGEFAFSGCDSLDCVVLPDGVTEIGLAAFSDCTALTQVTLPAQLGLLEGSIFSNCTALRQIAIPEGVSEIGWECFAGCSALTQVEIPASVGVISFDAWIDCPNLASVTIAPENTAFACRENALLSQDAKTLYFYFDGAKNASYTIPAGVETIETEAFLRCKNLKEVIVSEGVLKLSYAAFRGCGALTSIALPASLEHYYSSITECYALQSVTIAPDNPDYQISGGLLLSRDGIYLYDCFFSAEVGAINLPEGISHIFGNPYTNIQDLKSVRLPKSLIDIGLEYGNTALGDEDFLKQNSITVYAYLDSDAYRAAKANGITILTYDD